MYYTLFNITSIIAKSLQVTATASTYFFFTECGKSSGKLPIVGTSGTRENQVNGTSVAEHTTTLHQVDSKNVGEAKAVVILEPNPKEV